MEAIFLVGFEDDIFGAGLHGMLSWWGEGGHMGEFVGMGNIRG